MTSSVIYYSTDARKNEIYSLTLQVLAKLKAIKLLEYSLSEYTQYYRLIVLLLLQVAVFLT